MIMKSQLAGVFLTLWAGTVLAGDAPRPALIPWPQKIQPRDGIFELGPETRIRVDGAARDTGQYLAAYLRRSTGFPFKVGSGSKALAGRGEILLTTRNTIPGAAAESYDLTVAPDSVVIAAPDPAGLFYGAQTFLQLLPPEIFAGQSVRTRDWEVDCLHIEDRPRFIWRGFMLDVSRHFFTKEEVRQLLDVMAVLKLNTFHWHLADDQGWRIQIKKYPRLTEVGAWRKSIGFKLDPKSSASYGPDGRYGGYYTQADVREVVAYAASRHITIVPEIEMPGHASAALAAYPQYSCSGGPYSTDMDGGIFAGVYCAGKDETFEFLQNVLSEIIELFPGKYVHIGGDEVPKDNWKNCPRCQARMRQQGLKTEHELQSYFVRRIEGFLNSHGRTLIGWSEIREGGLAQNAAIMDWIGGAVEAATAGHDVVMTPTKFCYFDYYQSTNQAAEPHAIGGYLPLSQVYGFEPVPDGLAQQFRSHIIGAQANLWTEYVPNFKHVQYMAFPRLCALSEVAWTPPAGKDYNAFLDRLQTQARRFDQMGINFRRASIGPESTKE
jgi:hexosaminidase